MIKEMEEKVYSEGDHGDHGGMEGGSKKGSYSGGGNSSFQVNCIFLNGNSARRITLRINSAFYGRSF